MLMQLGSVKFEVLPVNAYELGHDMSARFAEKPVLGARPPLEFIGPGGEDWKVKAVIFPEAYGGLDVLEKFKSIILAGKPQPMVRGDGKNLGWFNLDAVSEKHTWLNARGVPKRVDIDLSLRASGAPSGGSYFSIISGLL